MPLMRRDGSYFGTLCALDTRPASLSDDAFDIFHLLADLIAFELEADERQQAIERERRVLEDMIAIAGHDLRQPLTVLQGRAQLLARKVRRTTADASLASDADVLIDAARRAVVLSGLLLDLAQIESGGLILDLSEFDLTALIEDLIAEAEAVATGSAFQIDAPDYLVVVADRSRLGQVLRNLIENAVKFTPVDRGPISIFVRASETTGNHRTVRIAVEDCGIGVPDADLPRLFERRYRSEAASQQGISGSGLGLYIARQIIEAHHGSILAKRSHGGGLTVQLEIPRTP